MDYCLVVSCICILICVLHAYVFTVQMIPRKFVRKYGKDLDSRISLKAPNGLIWHVKLERQKDEIWLQDGWLEFARFYSIQFGHLLVFKYRGHCDFKVRIFDPCCTEIDYPLSRNAKLNIGELSQVKKRAIEIDHSTCSDLIGPPKKRMKKLALTDASHINGLCFMPKLQQEKSITLLYFCFYLKICDSYNAN